MKKALKRLNAVIVSMIITAPLAAQSADASYRLTLQEAIQRGLRANLGAVLAESRVAETLGTLQRRESLLLPRVRIETPVAVQSRSLAAMGITVPGVPEVVGPFSTYETRAYADQAVVDFQALHNFRAAKLSSTAANSDYQDARDQVVRNVAGLYLLAQSAAAQEAANRSRVETAQALYKLASDQRDAGVATGIDVLRAQVQLANERQLLVRSQNATKSALLSLARSIGISPGAKLELAEQLEYKAQAAVSVENVIQTALNARPDYQSLQHQHEMLIEQLRASQARFLPRLYASANYGGIGRTVGSMRGTGTAQMTLSFQVFDRDRNGENAEIKARMQRVESQLNDAKLGIEQELRQALLNLDSATEEVTVAAAGLDLAQKELDLAKLRFSEGVTNNIEVINAQDALSRAQQNSIVALTRHADARMSLARALGNTEQNYSQFLGGN